MQLLDFVWLCLSAAAAGGINALAGGGTLLTFPTLIGVLSRQSGSMAREAGVFANGTSTVALVPASLGSAWGFRRELFALRKLLIWLVPPSLVGAAIGVALVTRLPPQYFDALVPWLILTAATLFVLQPLLVKRKPVVVLEDGKPAATESGLASVTPLGLAGMVALQFCIAIYGGYFGAGIGILMLSGLGLMGLKNIHEMNGLKAVLGLAINGVAAAGFVWEQKIHWPFALAMMGTSTVGGYVVAQFSRKIPGAYVRYFVIVVGFSLAAYYFWQRLR
ncbi:MAG TPA: sulfite exporter TauE/SafE family protein [Pirellulaceae bacterium]|nr:sulfite exporter TauE/SafE family protein [Pirellulaceae bacterium]